jgi:hypothetical protein
MSDDQLSWTAYAIYALGMAMTFCANGFGKTFAFLHKLAVTVSNFNFWFLPRLTASSPLVVANVGFVLGYVGGLLVAILLLVELLNRRINSADFRSGGLGRYVAAFLAIALFAAPSLFFFRYQLSGNFFVDFTSSLNLTLFAAVASGCLPSLAVAIVIARAVFISILPIK